jgi:hypothetical protein
MVSILNCDFENFAVLIALVCSSWTPMNMGTSKRSILTPLGDEAVPSVKQGNVMAARPRHVYVRHATAIDHAHADVPHSEGHGK